MRYFKRKDGSVFGKVDSVSKEQVESYLKDGCSECDSDGNELKPKPKLKSKKK
jgi:hypothetical protein